jgi:hypothetical protein
MGDLLSQLRQFRVLHESRLSFGSDVMLDDAAREEALSPVVKREARWRPFSMRRRQDPRRRIAPSEPALALGQNREKCPLLATSDHQTVIV